MQDTSDPPEELEEVLLRLQALATHYQENNGTCFIAFYVQPEDPGDAYSKIFFTDFDNKHLGHAMRVWFQELGL